MDPRPDLPKWLAVTPFELRDLCCLALRLIVEERSREAAGMVAVVFWLASDSRGPATAREDGPKRRDVALAELCAAECLAGVTPVPPLHDVCQLLEVPHRKPINVDAGYGRGTWLTLRWVLGKTSRPPLDLPIRRLSGRLVGEVEVFAELMAAGHDRTEARQMAVALVADSYRLVELIEDTATRIRA